MSRHVRGEGSIYRRKDGRWAGSVFVDTTSGTHKRVHVYRKTRSQVHEALAEIIRRARQGVPTPDRTWTVGAYVEYWLTDVVGTKNRANTIDNYRRLARNHLVALNHVPLQSLTVPVLQRHLNLLAANDVGPRTIEATRSLLRAVLSQAEREELVLRNVAKLVQIETPRPRVVQPWSNDETRRFLDAAREHRWYAAFVLLLRVGLRRGEVLGLSWNDLGRTRDVLRIERQLQRINGALQLVPLKTDASNRSVALVGEVADAVYGVRRTLPDLSGHDLIFTSTTGTPVDPKNLGRAFHEIRERAGLRRIRLHDTRHTAATAMKDAGLNPKDAQLILGHAHITTTQQIYQHGDQHGQRQAMSLLAEAAEGSTRSANAVGLAVRSAVKRELSTGQGTEIGALTSGGPGGARTLDTLLKRCSLALDVTTLTSVTGRLRTRTYAHEFGFVAVKKCCQTSTVGSLEDVHADLTIYRELQRHLLDRLAKQSFPYSLIHASHVAEAA